ncbi:hypothetical protein JI739_05980 [Ramlibacter sp. AW1]|uniref:L,D-TPase catalytic domain-containing protein n=1 Tax=Ramlibacter aurantiacus TaxID=2801330 RepID=A0A936ZMA7_9BURK|nr:hypothetical protein [Ramlibacter aurantiacus]
MASPSPSATSSSSSGLTAAAPVVPQAKPAAAGKPASPASLQSTGEVRVERQAPRVVRVAHFGDQRASAEARHVANWALYSGDNEGLSVVVVDKKDARVFVFDPEGELLGSSPVLLGSMVGDHTVPGVGDKPIAEVLPEERTTPAGRFIAEPGRNTKGEDVVWVDFDAAVSMHRVRPLVKAERRLERLASPTPADNRISYGCINLPRAFYEKVLSPTVRGGGAVIYVLPETRTPTEVFGSYDVPNADVLALFTKKSR